MGKSGRYHGVTGGGGSTGFMPHGVGDGGFVGLADLKWEIFRVATYPFMVLGGYQGVCNQTMPQGVGHFCGLFWRPKFENSCISLQLAGWGEGGGEGFTLIPALFQGKPYSTLGSWALEMYFLPTRLLPRNVHMQALFRWRSIPCSIVCCAQDDISAFPWFTRQKFMCRYHRKWRLKCRAIHLK